MADGYHHKTEAESWTRGEAEAEYYQEAIERSKENALAQHGNGPDKKTIKPGEMPWEDSPQGRIKHIINGPLAEKLGTAVRGTDIYLQVIPPGSRSGKHRHMSEELVFVLEGEGYDLHWDPTLHVKENIAEWEWPDEPQTYEWIPEDIIFIPTNTAHQHVNASDEEPARILCCQNRLYNALGYGFEDLEQLEPAPEYKG